MKKWLVVGVIGLVVVAAFLLPSFLQGGNATIGVSFYDSEGRAVGPPIFGFYYDDMVVSTFDIKYSWKAELVDVDVNTVSSQTFVRVYVSAASLSGEEKVFEKSQTHSKVVTATGTYTSIDIGIAIANAYLQQGKMMVEEPWTFTITLDVKVTGQDTLAHSVAAELTKSVSFTVTWKDGEILLSGTVSESV